VEILCYERSAPMTINDIHDSFGALFLIYFIISDIFGSENKTHLGGCGKLDKIIKLDN
jgi:hypothetical protein